MQIIVQSLLLATALTTAVSAASPAKQPLADMFDQMDGKAVPTPGEAKNISGLPPLLWPLRDVPQQVVGSRHFSEKLLTDGSATAERARDLFVERCTAEGGRIEPAESNAAKSFSKWATNDRLPATQQYKHRWRSITSLCAHGTDRFLGAFYAAIFDPTGVASDGDIASRTMMRMFPTKTQTVVYVFRGDGIGSRSQYVQSLSEFQTELTRKSHAQEEKVTAELRANVKVGSETNCGTVIEVRPPLVQIAVPATTRTPNGQATFWSRIDRLVPDGFGATCMYGL